MLRENLKRANELSKEIEQHESRIKNWENSKSFTGSRGLYAVGNLLNQQFFVEIDSNLFDSIKLSSIASFRIKLQELEDELLKLE